MRSAASVALLSAAMVSVARGDACAEIDVSGAVLSASHDNTINSNEDYHRAFDSDETTKWLVYEGVNESVWVQIALPASHVVTKYGITSANDAQERDPSSWSVAASNDGVYFVTLDQQVGVTWASREERQVFTVPNTVAFSMFRFEFHSVRDAATANSLQIDYISLYEGACEDACCGVDCGDHGACVDGGCVCDLGFAGSACGDVTENWAVYPGRRLGGVQAPALTVSTAADLKACEALCVGSVGGQAGCVGVNFAASSGSCEVVAGVAAASGWRLEAAAASDGVAALLVSGNLQQNAATPASKNVAEEVAYTVGWDPTGHQMPRVELYIGESVTFDWEDANLRNLPQFSAPNHHDVYLFAGQAQYQRCDFRNARVVAVAPKSDPANKRVTWTSMQEGTYYFGSKYGTDCSVGQLKVVVQVKRRPSP